jgi:hypothetical protein
MKMPRVRFTVRRMMGAVAAAAILLGLAIGVRRRSEEFRMKAIEFGKIYDAHKILALRTKLSGRSGALSTLERESCHLHELMANHYEDLAQKYWQGAERPWLPVEPDPPEPK